MTPLDPTLQAVSLALVHFLWQGALIALAAAAMLRAARTPAARYTIGVAAMAAMLLAPFATSMWIAGRLSSASELRLSTTVSNDTSRNGAAKAANLAPRLETQAPAAARTSTMPSALTSATTEAGVLILWACGVLLLSGRLAGGWFVARRLAHRAIVPARAEIAVLARRVAGRLALDRAVRVFESSAIAVPMMVGWIKPVVLLPVAALGGLTATQLEALLAHELAHVRRHDYLVNLLQSAIETLLFYHPAVWWISRQVRAEREHCCDDLAVSVCDRLVYVSALADLAALSALAPRPLALAATDGSLLARVRRLLGGAHERRSSTALWTLIVAALVVVVGGMQIGPWTPHSVSAAALQQTAMTQVTAASPGRETSVAPVVAAPAAQAATVATPSAAATPSAMATPVTATVVEAAPALAQTAASPATAVTPQTPVTAESEVLLAAKAKIATALEEMAAQKPDVDQEALKTRLAAMQQQLRELEQSLAKKRISSDAEQLKHDQIEALTARLKELTAEHSLAEAKIRSVQQDQLATSDAARAKMTVEMQSALEKLQTAQRAALKGGGSLDSSGTYVWSEDGQRVSVRWTGPFKIADDDKDIAWVEAGQTVDVSDGSWTLGTGVEITGNADGGVTRVYRRNGANGAFDPDGKTYLAGALAQLITHTGFAADMRVARILRAGGLDAVLKEIDGLKTDAARHAYYVELIHQANLSPSDLAKIGKKASETIKSPDDLAAVIIDSAKHARGDGDTLLALTAATATISDAHDRDRAATALRAASPKGPTLTPAQRKRYVEAAGGIRTGYDQKRALAALVRAEGGR